jgi:3-hydroxy-9,10-secoandrosta-1,3,5(10)-triene-9,17-dione monooxygenase reductase component
MTAELRHALGRFATGVAIVSCRSADGQAVGLTVNSFGALSLDPPLVLWSLRRASTLLAAFQGAAHFAVNVLAEAQVELSRQFAGAGLDRFAEGHWRLGHEGLPLLNGAAATFECETRSCQPAGDHLLFIGEVLHFGQQAVAPLVFHGSRYHALGAPL